MFCMDNKMAAHRWDRKWRMAHTTPKISHLLVLRFCEHTRLAYETTLLSSSWDNTTPSPFLTSIRVTMNNLSNCGNDKIGGDNNLPFNKANVSSHCFDHYHNLDFSVREWMLSEQARYELVVNPINRRRLS